MPRPPSPRQHCPQQFCSFFVLCQRVPCDDCGCAFPAQVRAFIRRTARAESRGQPHSAFLSAPIRRSVPSKATAFVIRRPCTPAKPRWRCRAAQRGPQRPYRRAARPAAKTAPGVSPRGRRPAFRRLRRDRIFRMRLGRDPMIRLLVSAMWMAMTACRECRRSGGRGSARAEPFGTVGRSHGLSFRIGVPMIRSVDPPRREFARGGAPRPGGERGARGRIGFDGAPRAGPGQGRSGEARQNVIGTAVHAPDIALSATVQATQTTLAPAAKKREKSAAGAPALKAPPSHPT